MKSRIKKNSWLQDITPSEYTVGIIKCTVRFLLILYLFYESILPAILLFPLWFLYMKEWMEEKAIGKEQEFRRQFRDSIQTMAGALKAGYSVENAIRERGRNKVDDTVVSYVGSCVRDRDCSSVFDDSDLRKKREKKERYKMRKLLIRKNKDKKYVAAITTIELVLILVRNFTPYLGCVLCG